MRGIDVSSHDRFGGKVYKPHTEAAYQQSDFVIVKATQKTGYVNPGWADQAERALKDGKLLGLYHYAGGADPRLEADHFHSQAKAYVGRALPCLDWESYQNSAWGSKSWCLAYAKRLVELGWPLPMVYFQASAASQVKTAIDAGCPVWVAGYPTDKDGWATPGYPYSGYVKSWDVWQFTSGGGTDRNTSYRDAAWWAEACGERSVAVGKNAEPGIDAMCEDAVWWATKGNLGYDQWQRESWRESGWKTGTEVDCSSFVLGLLLRHGFAIGAATYTGNMSSNLTKHGWARVKANGHPKKGDILLNDGHHTALCVGGGMLVQASRGESGHRVHGGQAGDQDGRETVHKAVYDYPWTCYLRYRGGTPGGTASDAEEWWCGKTTTGRWQRACGTKADGVISGQSHGGDRHRRNVTSVEYGDGGSDLVGHVQRVVGVTADRKWGGETSRGIQAFLKDHGWYAGPVDGYFGSESVHGLCRSLDEEPGVWA